MRRLMAPPRRSPPPSRKLALDVLFEWSRGEDYAASLIEEAAEDCQLEHRDAAILQAIVMAVVRNLTLLDFWVGKLTHDKPLDRDTRDAVRMGLAQLFILDMQPHAAVHETVQHAGRAGALVNAALRRALREKDELLAAAAAAPPNVRFSHPSWLYERWVKQHGEATAAALCEWNQQPAPVYVRVNQLTTKAVNFPHSGEHSDGFYRVTSLPYDQMDLGECYVQDPSTAMAAALLAPSPSHAVLDACAAPGGKTAILAQMMRNDGRIIATDNSRGRLERMADNLDRLGVTNVTILHHDWANNPIGPIENKKFDRILLDVPCSNTGVMRRRVDVRWRLKASEITAMANSQFQLLSSCVAQLRPGGAIVYSTCSIDPEENEQVIQRMIEANPRLSLTATKKTLPNVDDVDGAYAARLELRA
jgi:16S rRNA (cytosine967-C5)-methyltransferase